MVRTKPSRTVANPNLLTPATIPPKSPPLAIVFYASAQEADGGFKDLSQEFIDSPFSRPLDDYAKQAKRIIRFRAYGNETQAFLQENENQGQKKQTIAETLELTAQQVTHLLRFGSMVKTAYNQAFMTGNPLPQPKLSALA